MFNFKKSNKEIKEEAQKQYEELLKESGLSPDNKEGFILGEKKDIYGEEMSLEDIINGHLYQ